MHFHFIQDSKIAMKPSCHEKTRKRANIVVSASKSFDIDEDTNKQNSLCAFIQVKAKVTVRKIEKINVLSKLRRVIIRLFLPPRRCKKYEQPLTSSEQLKKFHNN